MFKPERKTTKKLAIYQFLKIWGINGIALIYVKNTELQNVTILFRGQDVGVKSRENVNGVMGIQHSVYSSRKESRRWLNLKSWLKGIFLGWSAEECYFRKATEQQPKRLGSKWKWNPGRTLKGGNPGLDWQKELWERVLECQRLIRSFQ